MRRLASVLIVVGLSPSLIAGEGDPFTGAWRLNLRKSKYPPGTCPKAMNIEMESAGNGVRYRSETTHADGRRTEARYTAMYDGAEAIVMAAAGLMAPVSLRRVDERTVIASYKWGMQVIAVSRRTVSKNGRNMTVVTVLTDKGGNSTTSISAFDKVMAVR